MTADTMPGSKRPASASIADRVTAQLQRDYPPDALSWVADLQWSGPRSVPAGQIDQKAGDTEWSAAAADKVKLQSFRKRIQAGWRKPVILVRTPGASKLFAVDGHSRVLASAQAGVPVTAYIGIASADTGPWRQAHSRQLAGDGEALELTAQTPAASTVPHPFGSPSGPGLWRIKGAELDPYIQNVARALIRRGRAATRSQAIQMAYGLIQDWAAGRTSNGNGHVHPDVQAAAAKALAHMKALQARAHSHASDGNAVELAGAFNAAAHPRVAKGHGNAGQFGSAGTAVKGAPAAAGYKAATSGVKAQPPGQPAPSPSPGTAGRARQLRQQARKDRHLARAITSKANALVRVRDGYVAGVLTSTGKSTVVTKAVSAKRSAAAKKAAATRRKNGGLKKKARSSTKSASATKAANIRKLNGEIHLLRHDAKALLKSADRLDALASGL